MAWSLLKWRVLPVKFYERCPSSDQHRSTIHVHEDHQFERGHDLTSLARSTIYKYIALGTFPLPLSVGERCVRWLESEVHEWILERIAERDEKLQAVGKH